MIDTFVKESEARSADLAARTIVPLPIVFRPCTTNLPWPLLELLARQTRFAILLLYLGGNLDRRTEFTLLAILGVAGLAIGVLVWGQQTGRWSISADSFVPAQPVQTTVTTPLAPAANQPAVIVETFASALHEDTAATTADWNSGAGNVVVPAGRVAAIAQSLTVAKTTGAVRVSLDVSAQTPAGSHIYYGVSHDGGQTWLAVVPGQSITVANAQGDWRWRADLERGLASSSPVLNRLTLNLVPIKTN